MEFSSRARLQDKPDFTEPSASRRKHSLRGGISAAHLTPKGRDNVPLQLQWHQHLKPWELSGYRIRLQCRRHRFGPWVWEIPWRRERLPAPVFWPGEFHGLYSPWGHKELDTTQQLSLSGPEKHIWFYNKDFRGTDPLWCLPHKRLYSQAQPPCFGDTAPH